MDKDERRTERGEREWSSSSPETGDWFDAQLRQHRLRVVMIVVPGFVGVLAAMAALFPPPNLAGGIDIFYRTGGPQFIALISFVLCGFGAVMMYLQSGFRTPRVPSESAGLRAATVEAEVFDHFRRDVAGRLEAMEAREKAAGLSGEIDDELVDRVREKIDAKATEQYLEEIRSAVRTDESQRRRVDASVRLKGTIDRLRKELDALTRRGNFNLVAGSFVAVGGMVLLGYFVFAMTGGAQQSANGWDFVRRFLPQLSLVTIVEVFAYFFLRLYSRSLTEIKYFQNEISNFEAKLASVGTALEAGDGELLGDVVRELARTERNCILKKDEIAFAANQWKTEEADGLALARVLISALRSGRSREG